MELGRSTAIVATHLFDAIIIIVVTETSWCWCGRFTLVKVQREGYVSGVVSFIVADTGGGGIVVRGVGSIALVTTLSCLCATRVAVVVIVATT